MEVRGLPETRHMLIPLERMRRVGDIATKLKHNMRDEIKQTDEIKIYRDKFHIHDNENINIIKSDEEIIVYTKATETEYFEENEDNKETLLNVREKILEEREKNLEKKETEMRTKEEDIEALAKMKETELKEKIDDLQNRRDILKAKEKVLEKREEEFQLKEKDLRKKDEDFNLNLKAREEKLEQKKNEVESKEKALDVKIKNREEEFNKSLASKDEELESLKYTYKQLKKIGQTMRAKFQEEEKKVHALTSEKAQLEAKVASLQNSLTSGSPCPLQKRRKFDLPLSSKQIPYPIFNNEEVKQADEQARGQAGKQALGRHSVGAMTWRGLL